jgi:hypothetical protein
MDRYLQQVLKNWSNQQQPPENGRARLLLLAASHSYPLEESELFSFEDDYSKPHDLTSLQRTEPARIFDMLWLYHSMPALRVV